MRLTLLSPEEYTDIVLPSKCAGHYWIRGKDSKGRTANIIIVEARRPEERGGNPEWVLKSNRHYVILDDQNRPISSVAAQSNSMYKIESVDHARLFVLYAEKMDSARQEFRTYQINAEEARITIGRGQRNQIVYCNPFVSTSHAELQCSQGSISVRDLNSENNTYVNGRAVQKAYLKNGDVVYIMGLRIIVVGRFIVLNNPDRQVTVQFQTLREVRPSPLSSNVAEEPSTEDDCDIDNEFYYRPPRFKHDVDIFELKVDAPPANQSHDEMPMALLIGPSMTMGMASIASGVFAVSSAIGRNDFASAVPSLVMSLSMMLGTMMWPVVTRIYQRKTRQQREHKRQEAYKLYLTRLERTIKEEMGRQVEVLRSNDVSIATQARRVLSSPPQIWERTRKHTDFLTLLLGSGNLPMRMRIQYPERKFSTEDDNLLENMYRLVETERTLEQVPVCLSLTERYVSGVYGEKATLYAFAQNLILRIASLHGYDEIKLAVIYNENDKESFSFVRMLPHTREHERQVRYVATTPDEAKVLSSALDNLLEYRRSLDEGQLEDETPYFVVVCLDKELAVKTECVRRIMECKKNLKFSVISFFERLGDLPKECSAVVELTASGDGKVTLIDDVSREPISFRTDTILNLDIWEVTKVLANTEINMTGSRFSLPSVYTFFEMLDIGMPEHLNLSERWESSNPVHSLAAVIGIDQYGEPIKLDLHQKAHGPHGLIAGMTGSGKSELISAYILSMAVNFSPYEVAFILIDYKGGGMADAFRDIPHTAGVITNLDGRGINRSLVSLRSELHRRENIFKDVSKQHSISNIDIYKYQELYRAGKVSKPLPHLLIISDEFAELKKDQPDFMTELTSAARVGRSLGVHLILATQKPGGVVDDQIRGNSRFRISLKVQDNADSIEMLGRPEAAQLVERGRFYLQVGNNELFEIGQSAWAGAPYYPTATVIKNRDDDISVIDTNGRVIYTRNTDRYKSFSDPPKQIDVLTEYIRSTSESANINRWKMWLDPLPGRIDMEALKKKYNHVERGGFVLEPIVGEYDDPASQRQQLMSVPISRDGNVIVYGSTGNGKSMFLEAMCYSLLKEHSPEEVNLYILDFDAELLSAFSAAPHVGNVVLSNESEKVRNLFKMLLAEMDARKKKLSSFGGDFQRYNRLAQQPEPNVIIMINNYAAFCELYEEFTAEVHLLSREGAKYGIFFVLTCTGVNNVRINLRQNFKLTYCLRLNNADDYSSVVGKTGATLPEDFRGRGLFRPEKELMEFQTACVSQDDSSYEFIREFSEGLARKYQGRKAPQIPVLPDRVTEEFLAPSCMRGDLSAVPVGVEKETLKIARYPFASNTLHLLLASTSEQLELASALARLIRTHCGVKTMLFAPEEIPGSADAGDALADTAACVRGVNELFNAVLTRNNLYKDAIADGKDAPEFEPLFVVIQSLSRLRAALERYKPTGNEEKRADDDTPFNRLQLALEKSEKPYRVYFLIAEGLKDLNPFTASSWYKARITGNSGIWVGNGINSQYRLNINKKPREYSADLEDGFGFVVKNGAAALVKFLS